jgi:hypothetical protein
MQAYSISQRSAFENSEGLFEGLKNELTGQQAISMNHAQLENLLQNRGQELLLSLFQESLDLRSEIERQRGKIPSVSGSDGVLRTHHRFGSKQLETIFGTVNVNRIGYSSRGAKSLYPLDAALNLTGDHFSFGVRKRVAIEASKGSFDEVVAAIRNTTAAKISKRQAENITWSAATDFDSFYRTPRNRIPDIDKTGDILVLSVDGKGVIMIEKDLKEATRTKAQAKPRKLKCRLSRGEKTGRKRMATVAAAYTIQPFIRTPEEIAGELRKEYVSEQKKHRPRPENKRVWAGLVKEPTAIIRDLFREAKMRDPENKKHWVALVDGNKNQLKLLKRNATRNGVELTIILDLIHVIEYLWKAAWDFFSEGNPEAEAWVKARTLEILRGHSGRVAGGIKRSATRRSLVEGKRVGADKCANYLLKYRKFLRYDIYLANGYPIATGVIEGACRYLIKDRMDITGARWSLKGAEAVLRLRSLRTSGDFEEYWEFHQKQEYAQNHQLHYEGEIPMPVREKRSHLRVIK